MKQIVLSICIPTYNRAEYIGEAIESVLSQITPEIKDLVEICISDNASTDNTNEIVKQFQEKNICKIIYHKNEENIGADRNFLKVIEIANGEYCWYLGSDDILVDKSLHFILKEINNNKNDIYLFNREEYSIDLSRKIGNSDWFNFKGNKEFDFSKIKISEYLKDINELGGIFSFISAIVFKKENWDSIKNKNKFVGTFYSHTYVLSSILKLKKRLKVIDMPLIICRINDGENTFGGMLGDYKRLYIDYFNILIFIDIFGMDSEEVHQIKKILLKQRNLKTLLAISNLIDIKDNKKLLLLLNNLGFTKEYLILKYFPKNLLPLLRKVYKAIKK